MKHKYVIQRNVEKDALTIQEYAELDKDDLSLICEETYPDAILADAIAVNHEALLHVIRTDNFYPPNMYANEIAGIIIDIYNSENNAAHELTFNDIDFIAKDIEKPKPEETSDKESSDIDDLLEEGFEDSYDEKEEIDNINTSLKVADDETLDIEDDV